MITETDPITRAIDSAAQLWPALANDRAALLRQIIASGIDAVHSLNKEHTRKRLESIDAASGAFTGVYPAGYRQNLAEEWPE